MSYQNALTALAGLAVSGVVQHYGIDAIPDTPLRGALPALLVLPLDFQENHQLQAAGQGYEALAFSSGAASITYSVTHLLLVAPVGQSKGSRAHLPALVARIDAYFAAWRTNPTLNGTLREPAQVRVEPGIFTFGGVAYYGCAFRHRWLISA